MENTTYKVDHRYNPNHNSQNPSSASSTVQTTPFSYRAQIEQLLMRRTQEQSAPRSMKKETDVRKDEFDLIMEEDLARQLAQLEMQEAEHGSPSCANVASTTGDPHPSKKETSVLQRQPGQNPEQSNKVSLHQFEVKEARWFRLPS